MVSIESTKTCLFCLFLLDYSQQPLRESKVETALPSLLLKRDSNSSWLGGLHASWTIPYCMKLLERLPKTSYSLVPDLSFYRLAIPCLLVARSRTRTRRVVGIPRPIDTTQSTLRSMEMPRYNRPWKESALSMRIHDQSHMY